MFPTNDPAVIAFVPRLRRLDDEVRKRRRLVSCVYAVALAATVVLYWFFPFPLCRIGSVVLAVAFMYMIRTFRQITAKESDVAEHPGPMHLASIDAQIRFLQSVVYPLPFVVGANLFWIGLPGTGTLENKAFLDCLFLAATVLVFSGIYLLNQRTVKQRLIPLRNELESFLAQKRRRSLPPNS